MTSTAAHDLTQSWTEVASGSASVTVQLLSNGPVYVVIAAAEPAADAVGILLWNGGETSFSGNALTGTDKVFLRSKNDEPERAVVLKS